MSDQGSNRIKYCENCGGQSFEFVFSGGDKFLGIEGNFNIIRCQNCGIYLLSPKISEKSMQSYYSEDYVWYQEAVEDDKDLLNRLDRENAIKKRCRVVSKYFTTPGKMIDIGCATGLFLNEMKQQGWITKGIEPNKNAAEYAKNRFELDVFNGYLTQANLPDETYDLVTLWDVLEHVRDVNEFMDEIHRILKPNGVVIGTLPNAIAWERYLFGKYWLGWDVPRHYRTHTPHTIKEFLRRKSFEDIEIFSFIGRHGAFMLSVGFLLNTWNTHNWIKKCIHTLLGSLPFRILSHPFFLIAERFNRSNIMSFYAKKEQMNKINHLYY